MARVRSTRSTNRVFSRDVTAAMLASLNKGTAAMLVSPTNPLGIEFYSYANVFFWFGWKTCSLITWVKTLLKWKKIKYRNLQSVQKKRDSMMFITTLGNWIELESTSRSQAVCTLEYGSLNQPIACSARSTCCRERRTNRPTVSHLRHWQTRRTDWNTSW